MKPRSVFLERSKNDLGEGSDVLHAMTATIIDEFTTNTMKRVFHIKDRE